MLICKRLSWRRSPPPLTSTGSNTDGCETVENGRYYLDIISDGLGYECCVEAHQLYPTLCTALVLFFFFFGAFVGCICMHYVLLQVLLYPYKSAEIGRPAGFGPHSALGIYYASEPQSLSIPVVVCEVIKRRRAGLPTQPLGLCEIGSQTWSCQARDLRWESPKKRAKNSTQSSIQLLLLRVVVLIIVRVGRYSIISSEANWHWLQTPRS